MKDLIIIGAGPAGVTAAIYAARQELDFMILGPLIGGQVFTSGEVGNYTGFNIIDGAELSKKFKEHLDKYNIKVKNELVQNIEKKNKIFLIKTNDNCYETKSVIIASGAKKRQLGIKGEGKFMNKGVVYCSVCDGPLFKGKTIALIGGGNCVLEACIRMIPLAKKIYLINDIDKLKGDKIYINDIKKAKNVKILYNAHITEVFGDKFVKGIKVDDKEIKVEGVFVEIGSIPNDDFIDFVEKRNGIIVDKDCRSSFKGVFAAGDVTNNRDKQIATAVGEGCKAILSAFEYLENEK